MLFLKLMRILSDRHLPHHRTFYVKDQMVMMKQNKSFRLVRYSLYFTLNSHPLVVPNNPPPSPPHPTTSHTAKRSTQPVQHTPVPKEVANKRRITPQRNMKQKTNPKIEPERYPEGRGRHNALLMDSRKRSHTSTARMTNQRPVHTDI
jgi:hypothetical protein